MTAEDLGGGFGKVVEREVEFTRVLAEAFRCCFRQARQTVEKQASLILAEALCRRVRQAWQAAGVERNTLVPTEALRRCDRYFHSGGKPNQSAFGLN